MLTSGLLLCFLCFILWVESLMREGDFMPMPSYNFAKKWPPISDKEFVLRCKPGTNPETALKVRRIVSEQLGIPYDHVYPEQHFVNDLGCE